MVCLLEALRPSNIEGHSNNLYWLVTVHPQGALNSAAPLADQVASIMTRYPTQSYWATGPGLYRYKCIALEMAGHCWPDGVSSGMSIVRIRAARRCTAERQQRN